ncbi:MAG TPA: ATP-binding protein [Nitrospirota bacterium]|nr:ATP-binding protein [Nitrospirota bacterium]
MTMHPFSILVLGFLIVLFGSVLLWGTVRRYRRELGIRKDEREKTPDTAFIINAFYDVTKQLKEKEKELQRLKLLAEQRAENFESYNENILQCVTSGVMTFDRNCSLTTINRAAEEILALQRGQIVGKSCRELFDEGEITRAVHETVERKTPSARMEAMLDRPSGNIWLGFNTALLTDRQGDSLGVILSFSDLTEVKRLQEQMELRERLIALGEMSAGIAHELRNPMAVISGYLNLLAKKIDTAGQAIIRDITGEINGMNRIIGDLLTFARPASLNRVKVNIREMIEACVANVLQATASDPRVKTVLHVDDITISVDEVLMRQAFTNLFQNAVEAMPEAGTLTIEALMDRDLKIAISDTGMGIPSGQIKKIFLPFFTTKDRGVGLGLALVHKIILSHGGRIEAESREGQGTKFTVTLPARY